MSAVCEASGTPIPGSVESGQFRLPCPSCGRDVGISGHTVGRQTGGKIARHHRGGDA